MATDLGAHTAHDGTGFPHQRWRMGSRKAVVQRGAETEPGAEDKGACKNFRLSRNGKLYYLVNNRLSLFCGEAYCSRHVFTAQADLLLTAYFVFCSSDFLDNSGNHSTRAIPTIEPCTLLIPFLHGSTHEVFSD